MTDHREDIRAYAERMAEDMAAALRIARAEWAPEDIDRLEIGDQMNDTSAYEWGDIAREWAESAVLDVEHTARWFGAGFTEPEETLLLLTFGGPTVQVAYSYRYETAELRHSWGREPYSDTRDAVPGEEPDCNTWPMDADTVGEFVSAFFPPPLEV